MMLKAINQAGNPVKFAGSDEQVNFRQFLA
jgi:hypothetical protein